MTMPHRGHVPLSVPGARPAWSAPTLAFGPVATRRFGNSIGISNITPKVCPYSCIHCPVGHTIRMATERKPFQGSDAVLRAVRVLVDEARERGEPVDSLTFVADGEATMDAGLGRAIHVLRTLGIPVTVITNGALLPSHAVRRALAEADVVSIKVDAVREATWRRVNRPHRRLLLDTIRNGMLTFSESFGGTLLTETMLLGGVNDDAADLRATAAFVGELAPAVAYLTVPLRKTAENWVVPASEDAVARAVELFSAQVAAVEVLAGRGPAGPRTRRGATRRHGGRAGLPLSRA